MARQFQLRFAGLSEFLGDPFDEDPVVALTTSLTEDPGPHIDPIDAEVLDAHVDGEDIVATVILDPQDYIRQGIQFGEDPYYLLGQFKGQLSDEEMAELVNWMKTTGDLTVTMISRQMDFDDESDAADGLSFDQWPTQPDL